MSRRPEQNDQPGPGEAIGSLLTLLEDPRIEFAKPDVKDDLADLRQAYCSDRGYAHAVLAFVKEITRALRNPTAYGGEHQRKLAGVRRGEFAPLNSTDADLRLVIRPLPDGLRLIAMRHRHLPTGMHALS